MKFDKILPQLIQLASDVGEMILSCYKNDLDIEVKSNNTPLTIVDQRAHQMIIKGLKHITPNIPVLSEESEGATFGQRMDWQEYWLIDPLDGTRDFLEHTGEFCICIAYIQDHQSIFGLVYAPLTNTHYYGFNNKSYKQHNNINSTLDVVLAQQPMRVVVGRHSTDNENLQQHLKQLGSYQLNYLGSALKFCKIAEGVYDYYPRFGPCCEWDTAAGVCILQNAGGSVIDENGQPLRYNTKENLLSPDFFASGAG